QNTGALHQFFEAHASFGHEGRVNGADAFIEKQDFGLNGGHHTQRQAHAHTSGVGAQRHIEVVTEFGELCNLIHFGFHLLDGLAQKQPANDDVVVAGDFRIHAGAGKSTLLRLLSRIYEPTRGSSNVRDSKRNRVDFPAPLWPTSPTRSPSRRCKLISLSASTTTTLSSFCPMAPPAVESTAFFNERDFASKMGKSTHALYVSIETMVLLKPSSSRGSATGA